MKLLSTFSILMFVMVSIAQTTYFWRNDQNPGNNASWQSNSPVYFWNTTSNSAQIPPGNEILAFDGNAGTTMTNNLNATSRYRFEFFATNAASRTINGSTANTFFDFGGAIPAIYNNSGVQHTINFPILIGNTSTNTNPAYGFEINSFNGNFVVGSSISAGNSTGQKVLVLMSNDNGNGGSSSIVVSGAITNGSGSVALLKRDNNMATLTNTGNTYTGPTTINAGTLRLNPSGNTSMSTEFRLNGGALSTQNIATDVNITTSGNLVLQSTSTIELSSERHSINFSNSSAASWNSGASLTISGWQGTEGVSGTAAQIFIGNNDSSLSAAQIAQISFSGFANGAMLLSTGELVPAPADLPVEFQGMSALCNPSGSVSISWSTASECNSSHFDVERSMDGSFWYHIGSLEAAGNCGLGRNYAFKDDNPNRIGTNYYRLIQYDFDGRFEIFGPIASICNNSEKSFTIHPNPTADNAHISFFWEDNSREMTLLLRDATGRIIWSQDYVSQLGSNMIFIPLSEVAAGFYHLSIVSKNDSIEQIRILKQ